MKIEKMSHIHRRESVDEYLREEVKEIETIQLCNLKMLERLHHIGQVSVNKQLLSSLGPPYISALSLKYTYYVIFQTFSNEL